MKRIRIAGLEVIIEPKSPGIFDVSLVLPVFGKKTATASFAEVKAMRDAIDQELAENSGNAPSGSSAPPSRMGTPVRR